MPSDRLFAHLCPVCAAEKAGPSPHAFAAGYDCGDAARMGPFGPDERMGLTPLTDAERVVLAPVRPYTLVLQLHVRRPPGTFASVKGHSICFRHGDDDDGADDVDDPLAGRAADLAAVMGAVTKRLLVVLVGSNSDMDKLASRLLGSGRLDIRIDVLREWIAAPVPGTARLPCTVLPQLGAPRSRPRHFWAQPISHAPFLRPYKYARTLFRGGAVGRVRRKIFLPVDVVGIVEGAKQARRRCCRA